MSDADYEWKHDHEGSLRHLEKIVEELQSQITNGPQSPGDALVLFQEVLDEVCREIDDFASEESTLFPLIEQALPALTSRIESVLHMHRALDSLAAEIAKLQQQRASDLHQALPQLAELTQRFLGEAQKHAKEERTILQQAMQEMSPDQKKILLEELSKL